MDVKVCELNDAHKHVIKNLCVFYRYDLLSFVDKGLGDHVNWNGVIPCKDENAQTHEEAVGEDFWLYPGLIFPHLITLDGNPVGFTIVGTGRFVHPEVDYRLYDFFVLNKYRRLGVARQAVFQVFDRYPGWWEIGWLPRNIPAANCWPKLVREYAGKDGEEWPYDGGLPALRFYSAGRRV